MSLSPAEMLRVLKVLNRVNQATKDCHEACSDWNLTSEQMDEGRVLVGQIQMDLVRLAEKVDVLLAKYALLGAVVSLSEGWQEMYGYGWNKATEGFKDSQGQFRQTD